MFTPVMLTQTLLFIVAFYLFSRSSIGANSRTNPIITTDVGTAAHGVIRTFGIHHNNNHPFMYDVFGVYFRYHFSLASFAFPTVGSSIIPPLPLPPC